MWLMKRIADFPLKRYFLLNALILFAGIPSAAESEKSVALSARSEVRFAVVGGSESGKRALQTTVFKRVIREIKRQDVDLVVHLGNLIRGRKADAAIIAKEWQQFDRTVSVLRVPLYAAAGSSDIGDGPARDAWLERFGALNTSFTRGPAQFIILNTELPEEKKGWLGREQFEWLKATLEEGKNLPHRFIFLHRRLWKDKKARWNELVHPLLKEYSGAYVFAGDQRRFAQSERDGVHYYLTGGGGGKLKGSYAGGGFYHYLLVKAATSDVRIDVKEVAPFRDTPPGESQAELSLVAGPYLQNVTAHSATIMFRLSQPRFGRLRYRKEQGEPWRERTNFVENERFCMNEVRLDDLKSDSRYLYEVQVRSDSKEEWQSIKEGTFRTAPGGGRPFRFVVYGDSRSNPELHAEICRAIAGERPEFVLHTGDFVGIPGLSNWMKGYFAPASVYTATLPLWPCLGNHDQSDWYYTFMALPNNERWYCFDWADAHFIVLDSEADMSPSSRQFRWLEEDLAKTSKRWKFITFHRPIYSATFHGGVNKEGRPRRSWQREAEKNILPLAEKHGVRMFFWGHAHAYERSTKGKFVFITTGGGGVYLHSVDKERNPYSVVAEKKYHYCIVEIEGNRLKFLAKTPDGIVIDRCQVELE